MKTMICYIDGSYRPAYPTKVGSAVIIVEEDGTTEEIFFSKDDKELAKIRNVGGELRASMQSIHIAVERGYDKIQIHYDYEGIEKWAIGIWKAKNEYTKAYKEYCQQMMQFIKIEFIKVNAHSGDYYNELADCFAKKSLEL